MSLLTNAIEVPSSLWVDLGAGPLTVAARSSDWVDVALVVSDERPPAELVAGEPLQGRRFFAGPAHVWASAVNDPVVVIVTAPDGSAASAADSGGGGLRPSDVTPLIGTFATAGTSGSFLPLAGRSFNVSLWGWFAGRVHLERCFDGGATWLPITAAGVSLYAFAAAASESAQEDEVGVLYRLNCTSLATGPINYRLSQ